MDDKTPGKRICIIRNAESKTNASMIRMMDALLESGYSCSLLTRTRYTDKNGITEKTHLHKNTAVPNAEIALKQEDGRGLGNIFQLLRYQWTVFIWLLKNHAQFDCMHAFDLDAGLPVRFAAALRKKKYVYHIADFYVDSRGGIPGPLRSVIKHMEFGVIHHAEATIVCTEERKKQIAGSRPKELIVIHNTPSLSPDEIADTAPFADDANDYALVCGYVGDLAERRFGKIVLDTFKKRPEYALNLAGMGQLAEAAKAAADAYPNIHYYGKIDYGKALALYRHCDIMYAIYDPSIPNHRYSAPNKVYEAMMLKKPILVAKGTGVDALVEKEGIGLAIDYNGAALEQALDALHANPALRADMSRRAGKAFAAYSWDEMKKRLIHLYEKIMP